MQLATLCYVRKNGKTLMIYRNKKPNDVHEGKWNGLGGKFNAGEMPEECAVREVLEESGLRVKNPRLHGILTFPLFSGGKDWYVFVYVFDDFDGNLIESDEGQLAWIDDNELLNLNLWEGDLYFLRWINEKRFFSGKFIYEAGRLQDYKVIFHDI